MHHPIRTRFEEKWKWNIGIRMNLYCIDAVHTYPILILTPLYPLRRRRKSSLRLACCSDTEPKGWNRDLRKVKTPRERRRCSANYASSSINPLSCLLRAEEESIVRITAGAPVLRRVDECNARTLACRRDAFQQCGRRSLCSFDQDDSPVTLRTCLVHVTVSQVVCSADSAHIHCLSHLPLR